MGFTKRETKHWSGKLILVLSLAGCSTQTGAGSTSSQQGDAVAQASGAEAPQPVESTYERESRMEALIASRNGTVLPPDPLEPPKADAPTQPVAAAEPAADSDHHGRPRAKRPARRPKSAEHRASAKVASARADAK